MHRPTGWTTDGLNWTELCSVHFAKWTDMKIVNWTVSSFALYSPCNATELAFQFTSVQSLGTRLTTACSRLDRTILYCRPSSATNTNGWRQTTNEFHVKMTLSWRESLLQLTSHRLLTVPPVALLTYLLTCCDQLYLVLTSLVQSSSCLVVAKLSLRWFFHARCSIPVVRTSVLYCRIKSCTILCTSA